MIIAESRLSHRLLGSLDRGVELLSTLNELCENRHIKVGEVRAHGVVSHLELRTYDETRRNWEAVRRFNMPVTLFQLEGMIGEVNGKPRIDATCVAGRGSDNGIEVLGGALVRAEVLAVEFVIDAYDDVILPRVVDPASGIQGWQEFSTRNSISPLGENTRASRLEVDDQAPAAEATWDEAIDKSANHEEAEEQFPSEPPLAGGDILEHPRFGRCAVERIEGESEFAQVRLRNGRLIRLALDVLLIKRDGQEGTQRRFIARLPRK